MRQVPWHPSGFSVSSVNSPFLVGSRLCFYLKAPDFSLQDLAYLINAFGGIALRDVSHADRPNQQAIIVVHRRAQGDDVIEEIFLPDRITSFAGLFDTLPQ